MTPAPNSPTVEAGDGVKERPILFSAPMVKAILAGEKAQTRRVVKPRGRLSLFAVESDGSPMWSDSYILDPGNAEWLMRDNPYGKPGDRLWVRETWGMNHYQFEQGPIPKARPADFNEPDNNYLVYRATEDDAEVLNELRWWPSIHMPRWASRISLEITGVRVERLHAITTADIYAEGAITEQWLEWREDANNIGMPSGSTIESERDVWQRLWSSINGSDSWAANPFVWVIEFKALDPTGSAGGRNMGEREVDCPRCMETCGWCGDYRWMHGQVSLPNGSGHKRYCLIDNMAPDEACTICGGSTRVLATTTFRPIPTPETAGGAET